MWYGVVCPYTVPQRIVSLVFARAPVFFYLFFTFCIINIQIFRARSRFFFVYQIRSVSITSYILLKVFSFEYHRLSLSLSVCSHMCQTNKQKNNTKIHKICYKSYGRLTHCKSSIIIADALRLSVSLRCALTLYLVLCAILNVNSVSMTETEKQKKHTIFAAEEIQYD